MCTELHKAEDVPSWGTPLPGVGRRLPGRVEKGLEVCWRAESPQAAPILSDFRDKPHSPGSWLLGLQQALPSCPHIPLPAPGPPRGSCTLQKSPIPLPLLSPPKKPAVGLGAAAAGGAAAGRAAEGPGAAGAAAGGSLPGSLCTQREPGAGGCPAQAGGAEVGSPGLQGAWWREGREAVPGVRLKDQGDPALTFPQCCRPRGRQARLPYRWRH